MHPDALRGRSRYFSQNLAGGYEDGCEISLVIIIFWFEQFIQPWPVSRLCADRGGLEW